MDAAKPLVEGAYLCAYGYVHDDGMDDVALDVLAETEEILRDATRKRYACFAELLAEIDAEIEAERDEEIHD